MSTDEYNAKPTNETTMAEKTTPSLTLIIVITVSCTVVAITTGIGILLYKRHQPFNKSTKAKKLQQDIYKIQVNSPISDEKNDKKTVNNILYQSTDNAEYNFATEVYRVQTQRPTDNNIIDLYSKVRK